MKKHLLTACILFFCVPLVCSASQSWLDYTQQDPGMGPVVQESLNEWETTPISDDTIKSLPIDIQEKIKKIQNERLSKPDEKEQMHKSPALPEEQKDKDVKLDQEMEERLIPTPHDLPPAPSKIENIYRTIYASPLAKELNQFGYELFESASFMPPEMAVPDPNYVIGPGDTILVRFWGSGVGGEFSPAVAPDGTINIPQIGVIKVAGLKFGQLEAKIRSEAEKYIQGINLHVAMQEMRSVEVYVVGAVSNPGLHVVPAFSTVMTGLMAAGGVTKSGSLRQIDIYRGQKKLRQVDLYELLLKGSRRFDITLEDRDVVFVPRIGDTVAVAGAVKQEAIFEIQQEKSIGGLIELAGGILPQGFTGRVYLRRFDNNLLFTVQDIDTRIDAKNWRAIPVNNGDLLEVQYVPAERPAVVRLDGNVWMPDVFQFNSGMKLSDILTDKDLLKPGSVMDFAYLYRFDPKTTRTAIKQFPLQAVFAREYDQALQPYDKIVILARDNLNMVEEITVQGAVWRPGKYRFEPDTTLKDAIALAGGTKFGAHLHQIEVSRQQIKENQVVTTHLRLDLELNGGLLLQPFDYIVVPMVKEATVFKTVTIKGEVRFPGEYRIKDGETVSDLIQRAGGFTQYAYFYGAKYTSEKARQIQQQSIDRMIQNLQVEAQRALSEEAQTALTGEDIKAAQAAQSTVQNMLVRLQAIEAEGRVSIVLSDLDEFRNSKYDFKMENGDALEIPKRPNFVAVVGSVYSPSAYLWEKSRPLEYYLEKSGGPIRSADDKRMYVIKANGEVLSKVQTYGFSRIPLMPGDTIVVPEDLERVPYLRLVKDLADIIFKVAVTAGVLIAIF